MTVPPDAPSYQYLAGWLQLVDHSAGDEDFEIDQYLPLADASHPFCFPGYSPRFFDAPDPLSAEVWDRHRPLQEKYRESGWTFAPGFLQDPLRP